MIGQDKRLRSCGPASESGKQNIDITYYIWIEHRNGQDVYLPDFPCLAIGLVCHCHLTTFHLPISVVLPLATLEWEHVTTRIHHADQVNRIINSPLEYKSSASVQVQVE